MVGPMLRAGAWPVVVGISGVAVVVGGCGSTLPAAATVLFPICRALLVAAARGRGRIAIGPVPESDASPG